FSWGVALSCCAHTGNEGLMIKAIFACILAMVVSVCHAGDDLKPAAVLDPPSGIVQDKDGTPIADAQVLLYYNHSSWGAGNSVIETVKSDASGHFKFTKKLTFELLGGGSEGDHYIVFARDSKHALHWAIVGA